ncbi:MAG: 2-C-methyl-D-erythritol 4-phosphate cytidylyltransferase [Arenimonas sp.]
MSWAVIPAAGSGRRFGGDTPKQYLNINGRPLIEYTLRALLAHPGVDAAMVAIAPDDPFWAGWREMEGKPIYTCMGGGERADSVLAGLMALPQTVDEDQWVLVHDAARPCVPAMDLTRLIALGQADPVGALLAAPVRDTVKSVDAQSRVVRTEPRERLWRALTPQMFRRGGLTRALRAAIKAGVNVTDEAAAMERLGLKALVIEGDESNIKVTTPADLALVESMLRAKKR